MSPNSIPKDVLRKGRILAFLEKCARRGWVVDRAYPAWPREVTKDLLAQAINEEGGAFISKMAITMTFRELWGNRYPVEGQLTLRQGRGKRPYVYFLPSQDEVLRIVEKYRR